jgi:hypothetical protein
MSDILDNFSKFNSENSYNRSINNGLQNYNKMKKQQLMFTDDLDNYINKHELLTKEKMDFEMINKRSMTVNIIFIVMVVLMVIIFLL